MISVTDMKRIAAKLTATVFLVTGSLGIFAGDAEARAIPVTPTAIKAISCGKGSAVKQIPTLSAICYAP